MFSMPQPSPPVRCDASSPRFSLFVSRLFFAIFYMQIEFSSILIGFLIGYTCVYIRTSRLTGSTRNVPALNLPLVRLRLNMCVYSVFICKNI